MGTFFELCFSLGPLSGLTSEPRLVLRLPLNQGSVTGAPSPNPPPPPAPQAKFFSTSPVVL